MEKTGLIEKIFSTMGTSENCGIVVMCTIAAFKGVLRPFFALRDKKSDPETRKYTAMREGLTEVAALPLYATLPLASGWAISKIFKNHPMKDNIKANTKFAVLGIATMLVPVICNKIQPPIMEAYKKHEDAKKTQIANTKVNSQPLKTVAYKANYGMKVGG